MSTGKAMSPTVSTRSTHHRISLRVAFSLFFAAFAAWGALFAWQYKTGAFRRHIEAGMEYARLGKGVPAEREWRQAAQINPNDPRPWELLGEFYRSTDHWADAALAFQQLLKVSPDTPHVYSRLAAASLRANDEVAALKYAQEELKRDANDRPSLAIVAALLADTGDDKSELNASRKLVELDPANQDYLSSLVETLISHSDFAQAHLYLDRLRKLAPDRAQTYTLSGILRYSESNAPQDLALAETDFRRSLERDPFTYADRLYLGKIYQRTGRLKQAIFQFEEANRLLPDKENTYYQLFIAYQQAGETARAEQARKKFEAFHAESTRLSQLEKRSSVSPNDFTLQKQAGLLSLKRGDMRRAEFYLARANSLHPEDTEVKSALTRVRSQSRNALNDAHILLKNGLSTGGP